MAKDILLGAFFTATKVGKTGLSPIMDVFRVTVATLAVTQTVTDGAMTAVGGGLYAYRVASADLSAYYYFAVAKTSDGTVDQQHVPAAQLDFGTVSGDDSGRALLQPTQTGVTIPTVTTLTGYTAPDNASIGLIKAKTDLIPAQPAAVGSAMTLAADSVTAAALAVSAVSEIQSGLMLAAGYTAPDNAGISSIITELAKVPRVGFETRWTNTGNGADYDQVDITAAT